MGRAITGHQDGLFEDSGATFARRPKHRRAA